jgi:hypothetical protein
MDARRFGRGFSAFVQGCQFIHLQRLLATDEVGPGANLGGDTLGAGELLVHALSEESSSLWEISLVYLIQHDRKK